MQQEFVLKSTGGEAIGYFSSMRLWFTKMKGASAEIIGDGLIVTTTGLIAEHPNELVPLI